MPARHTASFQVRYTECDAYGHLNNTNYIRFMQEAALDASAAVGFPSARYARMGRAWLVRETDITYLGSVGYGQTLEVSTWVEDFRRVRSFRAYEFRIAGQEELVARATTDWVYADRETGRPQPIPQEVILAYMPEGTPADGAPRARFPQIPAPPPGAFTLHKRVEWRDIDAVGHLNNAAYFQYFEDASTQVGRGFGWPMARMLAEDFAMVARQIRVQYLAPALMDDELAITTWIVQNRHVIADRYYALRRVGEDALLAQALATWVAVDLKTMRPRRPPGTFIRDFGPNIVGYESDE
jgi:acyl-CoA thioester hydrolase